MSHVTTQNTIHKYVLIWAGQFVSLLGSSLTLFSVGLWTYQQTESTTALSILLMLGLLPGVLVAPLAGGLADRLNRLLIMLVSDLVAALFMLVIMFQVMADSLSLWSIYLTVSLLSISAAFQLPAYAAIIPQLVPKSWLGRANGMAEVAAGVSRLLGPILASVLLGLIGLQGILLIDLGTFVFAVGTLLFVQISDVKPSVKAQMSFTLWQDIRAGIAYLVSIPGLWGLLILFAMRGLFAGMISVLITPLVLSFASEVTLGTVLSIGGSGMLIGSIVMSVWGGPRKLVDWIIVLQVISGVAIVVAGIRPCSYLIAGSIFVAMFTIPITRSCHQIIWQRKIPSHLHGRLFALRQMIMTAVVAVAYLVAGPLADWFFEPLLNTGTVYAQRLEPIIGAGPGRGIGFMFVVIGILAQTVSILAYAYSPIRHIEREVPDALVEPTCSS